MFSSGLVGLVLAGPSASLRDQPRPFKESRKEADVMLLLFDALCDFVRTDAGP